jgi:peptidoglycan/LPS O-acetylase OafA/YrhL
MAGCLLAFWKDELSKRFAFLCRTPVFVLLGILTLATPFLLPRVRLLILFGGLPPIIIALFIYAAIERKDWFLNNRFMFQAGLLSYSLYLWQQPFLNRNLTMGWTRFPINILLAVGCATGSYYVVERPFLSMFRGKRRESPTPVSAAAS